MEDGGGGGGGGVADAPVASLPPPPHHAYGPNNVVVKGFHECSLTVSVGKK